MTSRATILVSFALLCVLRATAAAQPPDRAPQDGRLSAAERPAGASVMLMVALDANRDGVLSAEELAGAEAALKKLDRDGDGRLTAEELRPALTGAPGDGASRGRRGDQANRRNENAARGAGADGAAGGAAASGAGLVWLLDVRPLHDELKLTEEQAAQFKKIAEDFRQQFRDQAPGAPATNEGPIPRSREQAVQRARDWEKRVNTVLQPSQLQRLRQIELQQRMKFSGPAALLQPEAAQLLQLTSEQTQALRRLAEELRSSREDLLQEVGGLSPEERGRKMAKRRQELEGRTEDALQKATAVLTAAQKERLAQLLGEPFDLERARPQAQSGSDRARVQRRPPTPAVEKQSNPGGAASAIDAGRGAASSASGDPAEPTGEAGRLGVGFLIGRGTEELIPLLSRENDFLEMMLGPEKVRYIRSLKPPARAMCVCESLEGVARAVDILQDAEINPDRVYIAYNPEPRPPGARQTTPREELDDYLSSLKKARELVKAYGAPLVMGPGLSEMAKHEHLYPEMARHCDIWIIQSQRLQLNLETDEPVPVERYREEVKRIVELLRQGAPDIRVFVQIIPLKATPRRKEAFTAERLASYVLAVEDLVDAAKIYGGNTELIAEVIQRVRKARPSQALGPVEGNERHTKRTEMVEMRDGARLATDLYLPPSALLDESEPIPVVLIRTPYNKDNENRAVQRWRDCLLENGYAVVIQDMRGFYASATANRTGLGQYDGYDTIEWLAEQAWCNAIAARRAVRR
jgi:hypothetical protein